MPGHNPLYYWDSCLFIAWLKDEERPIGDMDGVREVVELVKARDARIITSLLTSVEVLSAKMPVGIDSLFGQFLKRINRVGMEVKIADLAHNLRNYYAISGGKIMKTPDAIHLATAILYRVDEFHTFDDELISLSGNVAGHNLKICKPSVRDPQLDLRRPKSI
jgi:predicted nucleic acid-binding protein